MGYWYSSRYEVNSTAMDFKNDVWLPEVPACFHDLVANVSNNKRLQEERDFRGLRVSRVARARRVNMVKRLKLNVGIPLAKVVGSAEIATLLLTAVMSFRVIGLEKACFADFALVGLFAFVGFALVV